MAHGITKTAVERTACAGHQSIRQLFRIAWKAKHGSDPREGKLKHDLRRFDRRDYVPTYVRELVGTAIQF